VVKLAPSILSADFARLGEELKAAEADYTTLKVRLQSQLLDQNPTACVLLAERNLSALADYLNESLHVSHLSPCIPRRGPDGGPARRHDSTKA